ncbi:MAG: electron transport complex subunit RsxD [Gammaproteobacteria bacterium]|nr:electron transport complex subunit RsxD [Gammaproteobacteria bacterium]
MKFKTLSSPHIHSGNRIKHLMLWVIAALIPGSVFMIYFFGWGVLFNIVIASMVACVAEACVLKLRRRAIFDTLQDGSAFVCAWLLALALPPLAPWWLTTVGCGFAIICGKQLYGGLGYNPFNPAMLGYAVLLVSFPKDMSQWILPQGLAHYHLSFYETYLAVFQQQLPTANWDAISGATPLDTLKTNVNLNQYVRHIVTRPLFGYVSGYGWEFISLAWLCGGLLLLWRRIITWHIPISLLLALTIVASIFWLVNDNVYPSPLFHITASSTLLAAFFIATDPVSACTSNKGKIIYGAGIGILIYFIRTFGAYSDGIAFAVLLMNSTAPALDYFTKPRVFGRT